MARPSEIKAVRVFLEHGIELDRKPDETEEAYRERYLNEGAKSIIAAVDAARQDRTDYIICRRTGRLIDSYGPYATPNQAERALTGGKIPGLDGSRFFVIPLRNPTQAEAVMATLDEGGFSPEAIKLWEIARNGGQAAKTHSRRNRRRA